MVEQMAEIDEHMAAVNEQVERVERKMVSVLELVLQLARQQQDADSAYISLLEQELADVRELVSSHGR